MFLIVCQLACAPVLSRSPEPTMSEAVFLYERMPELGAKRDTKAPFSNPEVIDWRRDYRY